MKYLSIALISSLIYALPMETALKKGKYKADFALHYENYYYKNLQNSGYAMYSVGLGYKSGKFNNFQLNLGFRANNKIYELHNENFDDTTKSILHTANLTYSDSNYKIIIGRKKETMQWIHGFQEEIKLVYNKSYKLILLHTYRHGRANNREELKSFRKINGNDGLNLMEITKKTDIAKIQLYFYNAPNLVNWFGSTINLKQKNCNVKLVYSKSNELTNKPEGSYFNIESSFKTKPAFLTIGYIQTDKNGGLGSMRMDRNVYDNMNPLEEGFHIFSKDAKTIYSNIILKTNGKLSFKINVGHIKFQNKKANEIDFYTNYILNKNFSLELCLDKYISDVNKDELTAIKTQLTYKF